MSHAPSTVTVPGWVDRQRYRDPKTDAAYSTGKLAETKGRHSLGALRGWTERVCPALGRPIRYLDVPKPTPIGRWPTVRVYLDSDLDVVASRGAQLRTKALRVRREHEFRDDAGRLCLTRAQAEARHGVHTKFYPYWSRQRDADGKPRLTPFRIADDRPGAEPGSTIEVARDDEIRAILALGNSLSKNRPGPKAATATSSARSAEEWLLHKLKDGPLRVATVRQAARRERVGPSPLKRAIGRIKARTVMIFKGRGRGCAGYICLPGQDPPAVKPSSPARARVLHAVELGDGTTVDQLAATLREPPEKVRYHLQALKAEGKVTDLQAPTSLASLWVAVGRGRSPVPSNGNAENGAIGSAAAKPRRRGRQPDPRTAEVYEYCHTRYHRGDKLSSIRQTAARIFGSKAPKQDSHVILYAKRHAKTPRK